MSKYINLFKHNKIHGLNLLKNILSILYWFCKDKEVYFYFMLILGLNIYLFLNNILEDYWLHILIHEYFGFKIVEKHFKGEDL